MKISRLIVKNFQQFKHLDLDFTYPKGHKLEGLPLKKVCFIGRNGTGKTTILKILDKYFTGTFKDDDTLFAGNFFFKFNNDQNYYFISAAGFPETHIKQTSENEEWMNQLINASIQETNKFWYNEDLKLNQTYYDLVHKHSFNFNSLSYNIIFSPSESSSNPFLGDITLPKTNLNTALKNSRLVSKRKREIVSNETISAYWTLLIYHIKQRESNLSIFQDLPENQNKTIKKIKEKFDKENPKILDEIAKLWNKILDKAGLEFDVESAKIPIQLTDNLEAYIKLKKNNTKIDYNILSTGIRNYIFRLGYIFSVYFNRKVENGFLFIDEPENSLHPDFLYDLIETYQSITQESQLFFATHNPIIAAQFEPCERFILDFDEYGNVISRRGTTPLGDDPNDLLDKDFGVSNLMGKAGIEKWERFIELKKILTQANGNVSPKDIKEFSEIGRDYNFDID
jgi:predicted ATP-dependent endonuclease of OLD family